MPATIERPVFEEGQILGAEDLEVLQSYARNQEARHARYAHTWGIAEGLGVKLGSDGELEITAGLAVDSSGAALIVSTSQFISIDTFTQQLSASEKTAQYPLFLVGRQQKRSVRAMGGACGGTSSARMQEGADLQFRRQNALFGWDDQQARGVGDGPDDGQDVPRLILLGFASWDLTAKKFTKFDTGEVIIDGVSYQRRYLGVRADSIESIGGRLVFRTMPASTADAPLLILDPRAADGNALAFGVDNGQGGLKSLFSVNTKGDVTASGKIGGVVDLKPGEIHVQSGQITDGLRVPLPNGVTDPMVQSGNVTLHITLTPRPENSEQPPGTPCLPKVLECTTDEDRRVRCLIRWFDTTAFITTHDLPGVCDYVILATVTSTPEAMS